MKKRLLTLGLCLVAGWLQGAEAPERRWTFNLESVFLDQTKPLIIYVRERNGEWLAAVGSSRDPEKMGGKTFNRSWYCGEMEGVPIKDGKMKGRMKMHLTPDPWVPNDHRSAVLDIDVDAKLVGEDALQGTYKVIAASGRDKKVMKIKGAKGKLTAKAEQRPNMKLAEPVTFRCDLQGALVGGSPSYCTRCLVVRIGIENGKLVSLSQGRMDIGPKRMARSPRRTACRSRATAPATPPTGSGQRCRCRRRHWIWSRASTRST